MRRGIDSRALAWRKVSGVPWGRPLGGIGGAAPDVRVFPRTYPIYNTRRNYAPQVGMSAVAGKYPAYRSDKSGAALFAGRRSANDGVYSRPGRPVFLLSGFKKKQ